MKKTIILMPLLVIAVGYATSLSAQNSVALNNKKIVLPSPEVSKKVADNRPASKFSKQFPDAAGESWIKTHDGFVVRFTLKNIENMAFLTKGGSCISLIKYYTETELPKEVRHQVKSTYYDYSITGVKEVNINNATAYLVTIEDKTTWKVIRVVDGEMDVWEAFNKSE